MDLSGIQRLVKKEKVKNLINIQKRMTDSLTFDKIIKNEIEERKRVNFGKK